MSSKRTADHEPAYPVSPKFKVPDGGHEKRMRTEEGRITLPDGWKRFQACVAEQEVKPKDTAWVPHRDPTTYALPPTPTIKAYKNSDFLGSSHARCLRMMCEYEETMQRLAACGIRATVQFFGSARAVDRIEYDAKHAEHTATLRAAVRGTDKHAAAKDALEKLESTEWMIEYLDKTRELARRLTEWSMASRLSRSASISGVSRGKSLAAMHERNEEMADARCQSPTMGGHAATKGSGPGAGFKYLPHATDIESDITKGGLVVCTGGAGGFMEAANRGASDVPGGRSIGMGISLPFESGLNPYVTPELAFEYHYFFTRKLCMAFHMQALVVAPGGFGTCDEMFEMMTLKQTGKMQSNLPIVLLGKAYWEKVINWNAFSEAGTIKQHDVDSLFFTDDVDEAFDYITQRLAASIMSPSPPRRN